MTSRRTPRDQPAPDAPEADAAREAKGSVQEAIGKLIGDDAARARGTAQRKAAADEAADPEKSRRSRQ